MWLTLVVPLTGLAAVALAIHAVWDWDGLLVNVATEVLGIIITVAYVDWILRRHESARWQGTQERLGQRLQVFVNYTISSMRTAFGIDMRALNQNILAMGDVKLAEQELSRFSRESLEPGLRSLLQDMDAASWPNLARSLQSIAARADEILDRYSWQLNPRQVELLLDVQSAAQAAPYLWVVFPELAGTDPSTVTTSGTPPDVIQAGGYDVATREIGTMLSAARELRDA